MTPSGVQPEDYVFTVIVHHETWDIFHFLKDGTKKGTLAVTQRDGDCIIGLLRSGHMSEKQVVRALTESMN